MFECLQDLILQNIKTKIGRLMIFENMKWIFRIIENFLYVHILTEMNRKISSTISIYNMVKHHRCWYPGMSQNVVGSTFWQGFQLGDCFQLFSLLILAILSDSGLFQLGTNILLIIANFKYRKLFSLYLEEDAAVISANLRVLPEGDLIATILLSGAWLENQRHS